MRWHASLLVFSTLGYITLTASFRTPIRFPENYIPNNLEEENIEYPSLLLNTYEDEKLDKIGHILTEILISPWPQGVSPILYVENNPLPEEDPSSDSLEIDDAFHPVPPKRTRYYRKYPWKRQNARYDPGNRFICTPSKDDVYRLLVALHEARQGNRDRMVNFCNRKRPAHVIYTNIRYIGK